MEDMGKRYQEARAGGRPIFDGGSCSYMGHMCAPVRISMTGHAGDAFPGFWVNGANKAGAIASLDFAYQKGRASAAPTREQIVAALSAVVVKPASEEHPDWCVPAEAITVGEFLPDTWLNELRPDGTDAWSEDFLNRCADAVRALWEKTV